VDLLIRIAAWTVATILVGIVAGVIRSELRYSASEPPDSDASKGTVTLDYGPAMRILAWCAGLFFLALAVLCVPVYVLAAEPPSGWAISVGALFFVLLGLLSILEAKSCTTLDARGLHDYKAWRGRCFMPWTSVRRVRFSPGCGWFVIADDGGRVFRVMRFERGIPQLAEFCAVHLDPAVYGNAFDGRWAELQ